MRGNLFVLNAAEACNERLECAPCLRCCTRVDRSICERMEVKNPCRKREKPKMKCASFVYRYAHTHHNRLLTFPSCLEMTKEGRARGRRFAFLSGTRSRFAQRSGKSAVFRFGI